MINSVNERLDKLKQSREKSLLENNSCRCPISKKLNITFTPYICIKFIPSKEQL